LRISYFPSTFQAITPSLLLSLFLSLSLSLHQRSLHHQAPLYHQWLTSINHRSLMAPVRIDWKPLHCFIPVEHPLRTRLRNVVAKV
jgi:hypothetical protein